MNCCIYKGAMADMDVSERVLDKRIHLAETRARRKSQKGKKAFPLRRFLGIKKKSESETKSVGSVPTAAARTCDRTVTAKKVKVSFGRVECREFARTVGDNEVVGAFPLALDWEVLAIMVVSVDQYEEFRAPLHKSRKEDFLLATPEERVAALEKCGVVESQLYRLEKERLNRLKEEWSPHLDEMARTYPTKHQGPQGVRQSLKRSGRTWSANRRRMSLKSAKQNMKSLMKKLRSTLKRTGSFNGTYGSPLSDVPKVKATAWEALVMTQGELPTTFPLNLTFKWEKLSDEFVRSTCMLECCVVTCVELRI
jgi:hypothetical protein